MTQHYIAVVDGSYAVYVWERDRLTKHFLDGESYDTPREAIDAAKQLDIESTTRHITPGDWDDLNDVPEPKPAVTPDQRPETKQQRARRVAKERRSGRTH
jgi:hypothetical protein